MECDICGDQGAQLYRIESVFGDVNKALCSNCDYDPFEDKSGD